MGKETGEPLVSRLTDLIARAKAKDPDLGIELEREFKVLSSRRSFGLNFERHRPESVELPGRPIRKGDKVHVLPPRGETKKGDQRLWKVVGVEKAEGAKVARLELLNAAELESQTVPVEDLVVVAEFRDYIYPGLVSTGKVERGGEKPFHTVINGENFHALEALTFTHQGKVDVIYIDPPYNTGAKDWKYNNDYIEGDDLYRHSKWLAFMERRLKVARQLLSPQGSSLIVTIDEKEYLRLGLLLEQIFPDANIQMVSSVINPGGIVRANELSRVNEFVYFVSLGSLKLVPEVTDTSSQSVRWASLRRFEDQSRRHGPTPRLGQFYPVYVNQETGKIEEIGTPLSLNEDRQDVPDKLGCETIWPLKPDGTEMVWGLTNKTAKKRIAQGFLKATKGSRQKSKFTLYYLTSGQVQDIETGKISILCRDENGVADVTYIEGKASLPSTQWDRASHNAQSHGSQLVKSLIGTKDFPFPKSLYGVEDALRLVVGNKKSAVVLDFFAGSGTTAHAVMRLNRQDSGQRQSISITNNEVAADEQKKLAKEGLRPGDPDWEKWGICDYITKPRVKAAITGHTPDGKPIKGDYKFTDELPMAKGFEENAEFFTLTYEMPITVSHNRAFARIAPLLWMRAGSEGRRIDGLPDTGWDVADTYGCLTDLDKADPFCKAIKGNDGIKVAYIVTDDDRRFQSVARHLPDSVEPVRLYESYLSNFRFSMGR
jgi:adenine-specific DNA-methyltransferase